MANLNRIQTIDSVIHEAMLRDGSTDGLYPIYLEAAIDGYRDLVGSVIREGIKWVKFEPNSLNRYTFPSDMEDFVAIGVPVNGKLWPLTRNDEIMPTYTTEDGTDSLNSSYGEGVNLPTAQVQSLSASGGINLEGYYTIDWTNRRIIINANRLTELVLFYVSSGIEASTQTYVPARCASTLKAYIKYVVNADDRSNTEAFVGRMKMRYEEELRKLKRKEMPTIQEFKDAIYSTRTLLPI